MENCIGVGIVAGTVAGVGTVVDDGERDVLIVALVLVVVAVVVLGMKTNQTYSKSVLPHPVPKLPKVPIGDGFVFVLRYLLSHCMDITGRLVVVPLLIPKVPPAVTLPW